VGKELGAILHQRSSTPLVEVELLTDKLERIGFA